MKPKETPRNDSIKPGQETETVIRLYYGLERAIYNFFANRGCSREEARDLRQETFLKALQGIGRYRGEARLESWLFGIAQNVLKRWWRDGSRQKRTATEVSLEGNPDDRIQAPLETESSPGEGPYEHAVRAEQTQQVRWALAELPDPMRRCTLLRLEQEMPYRDIAELMQISETQVKTHLFRARKKLKTLLSSRPGDQDPSGPEIGTSSSGSPS